MTTTGMSFHDPDHEDSKNMGQWSKMQRYRDFDVTRITQNKITSAKSIMKKKPTCGFFFIAFFTQIQA
jgi:hypothetical protein